jgi:protein-tyrosine phosphatase
VYCKSGMSRSGSIALAYLLAYRDMTLIDALAFCRARRPIVSPNAGFMTQLAELEEEKRGRVTVDLLKYEENRFGEPTTLACAA